MYKRLAWAASLVIAQVAATPSGVFAAESMDLTVQGTIIPPSCDISLSDNGVVDFGNIFARDLSSTNFTSVGTAYVTVSLNCNGPTKVAILASDGRAGSVPTGIGSFLFWNQTDSSVFGTGIVDGKQIGGYIIHRSVPGTADGSDRTSIVSDNNGATWTGSTPESKNALTPTGRLHSWALQGKTVPGSFSTISQVYRVALALNKKAQLPDLTDAIPIDGLATISVKYL